MFEKIKENDQSSSDQSETTADEIDQNVQNWLNMLDDSDDISSQDDLLRLRNYIRPRRSSADFNL